MTDEPIPLCEESELSGSAIVHGSVRGASRGAAAARINRKSARHGCEGTMVCFSPELKSGGTEHVECPVLDISSTGMRIEYDRPLKPGTRCEIDYRTATQRPVHRTCIVKRCEPAADHRYAIGVRLDRLLDHEERRPARIGPGRDIAPGLRPRKLKSTTQSTLVDAGASPGAAFPV